MNFTISKSDFNEALQKIIGVVPQKTTISILSCILMELKEGSLSLTGTNLEISITTSLEVNAMEDGIVAIPAKLLAEIVRELPDVPLNIFDSDNKVVIKTDKGEYKITTQPYEDFPHITVEKGDFGFQIMGSMLKRYIDKTIFAVSTDELRPALTGINMELLPNELRFVSTDGHRLVRIILKNFSVNQELQRNLIIPTKTLNLLLRNIDEKETIDIQIGEDHVIFSLKDAVVYSKLISGSYPNYERVIPTDNDKILKVNKDLLISALRRVSIFSNSLTHQIRLILSPNEMTIRSEDIEFGAEAKEVIPVEFSADWLQIGYNSVYLLDVLRHMDTQDVIFEVKDSTSAAIIHPQEQLPDEDIVMLLMPIRINEDTPEEYGHSESEPVSDVDSSEDAYVE